MPRFHINESGKIEKCEYPLRNCPYRNGQKNEIHIEAENLEEAYTFYDIEMRRYYPILANTEFYCKRIFDIKPKVLY